MPVEQLIATDRGDARVVRHPARNPVATVVLTHGAGGGIDAIDLAQLARTLPASGVEVVLVEMPWRVAGKRLAPRPAVIDDAYVAVLAALPKRSPLFVGGRSAGARSACRIAATTGARGVIALAFPLHPPGRPERSRETELLQSDVPTLVVQGARDTFGTPAEFPRLPGSHAMTVIPGADHSMKVSARAQPGQPEVLDLVSDAVGAWVAAHSGGNPTG